MKKISEFLNDQNRVIINEETGYYTVISPCNCKKRTCHNFCMSIYRHDDELSTRLWISNDSELSMASHFFKDQMDTNKSLSKSILEDSKKVLVESEN